MAAIILASFGQKSARLIAEDLRWVFISFLFAFTVSLITERYGKLFTGPGSLRSKLRAFMDLAVATFVTASSWIAWSVAIEAGCCGEMNRVFERPTLELLVDIWLVIFYNALVLGIELPREGSDSRSNPHHVPFWIMLIFTGYLVWDIVVYVIISYPNITFGQYGSITLICVGISALSWITVKRFRLDNQIIVDLWLTAVLIFFRVGKSGALVSRVGALVNWVFLTVVLGCCLLAVCISRRFEL